MSEAVRYRRRAATARSVAMKLRLSPAERDSLAAAAREAGLTPSGYAAACAVAAATEAKPPRMDVRAAAIREVVMAREQLARVGSNLNQLTRQANTTGTMPAGLDVVLRMCAAAADSLDEATVRLLDA